MNTALNSLMFCLLRQPLSVRVIFLLKMPKKAGNVGGLESVFCLKIQNFAI